MKNEQIPIPLQRQILIQGGLASLAGATGLGLLAYLQDAMLMIPFGLTAVLLACGAIRLYHLALKKRFIILKGTILHVEKSFLRRRPTALLLEMDSSALRVRLRGPLGGLSAGDTVLVYVSDTAPVYPWGKLRQLSSYLALVSAAANGA